MRYVSTRGGARPVDFTGALLAGLAEDGGLFTPETWPTVSPAEIAGFAGLPYASVAFAVLSRFVGDSMDPERLRTLVEAAYATFSHPAVAPLRQLDAGVFLLELFHGPTLAFKDVAMQLMARLYDAVLEGRDRRLTLLCATSGDTGGAAAEAFRGSRHVRLVVLFPQDRISEVQRRFMTTTGDGAVRVAAVEGDFDTCQALVKAALADPELRTACDLSAVNSINWARIAAQSVYYFTAASALGAPGRRVGFVVPTGNFGDAFSGYAARRMGLDMAPLLLAANGNDILARVLAEGRYARWPTLATLSPAMDIQAPSNFERLYFEAVRRDGVETARAFRAFAADGALDLAPPSLAYLRDGFQAESIGEMETRHTLLAVLDETGELIDPHTAVGVAAARRHAGRHTPQVVLSTAHPAKFPETVRAATGAEVAPHVRVRSLRTRPERFDHLPPDLEAVKTYIRAATWD